MSKWLRQVELVNCVLHPIALIHTVQTNDPCFIIQGMQLDSLALDTLYISGHWRKCKMGKHGSYL